MCGIFRSAVLKLEGASESLGEFVKLQIAVGLTLESNHRDSESVSMGGGPIICIFNTFFRWGWCYWLGDQTWRATGLVTKMLVLVQLGKFYMREVKHCKYSWVSHREDIKIFWVSFKNYCYYGYYNFLDPKYLRYLHLSLVSISPEFTLNNTM